MFKKGEILRTPKAAFTGLPNAPFHFTTSLCPATGFTEVEWRIVMTKMPGWTVGVASIYGMLLAMRSVF